MSLNPLGHTCTYHHLCVIGSYSHITLEAFWFYLPVSLPHTHTQRHPPTHKHTQRASELSTHYVCVSKCK